MGEVFFPFVKLFFTLSLKEVNVSRFIIEYNALFPGSFPIPLLLSITIFHKFILEVFIF